MSSFLKTKLNNLKLTVSRHVQNFWQKLYAVQNGQPIVTKVQSKPLNKVAPSMKPCSVKLVKTTTAISKLQHKTNKICKENGKNGKKSKSSNTTADRKKCKMPDSQKTAECNICKKKFAWTFNLKRHAAVHSDRKKCQMPDSQKTAECNICKKRFAWASNLKRHAAVHSDDRPFQCEKCGYRFKHLDGLKQHRKKFGTLAET